MGYVENTRESNVTKPRQLLRAVLLPALTFCLLIVGAGVPAAAENEEWVRKSPHNFRDKRSCVVCHVAGTPDLLADNVTTCTKCHQGNVGNHPVVRHPIGKAPGRQLPVLLPTSGDGLMVCNTCHDQHNKARTPSMLRIPALKLCAACHKGY